MKTAKPGSFKERVFGIGLNVCDLNRPTLKDGAADDGTATHFERMTLHEPLDLGRLPEICDLSIHATLLSVDRSHVRVAQSDSRFDERIKHPLQVEGRTADDLEHVGGGGLLRKRFTQLVKQARVLDGNDRLISEALHQINLLVGERLHLGAEDHENADRFALLEHRHGNQGPDPRNIHCSNGQWIAGEIGRACPQVLNVDWMPSRGSTREWHIRAWAE